MPMTLSDAAYDVLTTASPIEKANLTREHVKNWRAGTIDLIGHVDLPDRPARPDKPELLHPSNMPKRGKAGSDKTKIALLHALAHIELNAIDLAWDIMARFAHYAWQNVTSDNEFTLPKPFFDDWCKVADDEAKHFLMLSGRLKDFNAAYGDLPAHDGLWESAERTAEDFAARLAIVPMVLEARGLDVTPGLIDQMKKQGDHNTAELFQIIHDDEITHVKAGTDWYDAWCKFYGKDIETTWQDMVQVYFNGKLKRPFNDHSRQKAGMLKHWYDPLAEL